MKLVVHSIQFNRPLPALQSSLGSTTCLTSAQKGWAAVADTETREIILKARKTNPQTGKVETTTYHLPFESVCYYTASAQRVDPSGEPNEPA